MRHHSKIKKFGREKNQRGALMRSLLFSLLRHGKIQTTEVKAKALRPIAEKVITAARKDIVASRRKLREKLPNRSIIKKLFSTIAPKYIERKGGYTRITKTGTRLSDGAKMAVIELITDNK